MKNIRKEEIKENGINRLFSFLEKLDLFEFIFFFSLLDEETKKRESKKLFSLLQSHLKNLEYTNNYSSYTYKANIYQTLFGQIEVRYCNFVDCGLCEERIGEIRFDLPLYRYTTDGIGSKYNTFHHGGYDACIKDFQVLLFSSLQEEYISKYNIEDIKSNIRRERWSKFLTDEFLIWFQERIQEIKENNIYIYSLETEFEKIKKIICNLSEKGFQVNYVEPQVLIHKEYSTCLIELYKEENKSIKQIWAYYEGDNFIKIKDKIILLEKLED